MDLKEITDENYRLQMEGATGLVLFYKSACPHCKNLKMVIQKFVKKQGPLELFQINSEENQQAMTHFEVERVPTILVVKAGEVKARKAGLMNPREMAAFYRQA